MMGFVSIAVGTIVIVAAWLALRFEWLGESKWRRVLVPLLAMIAGIALATFGVGVLLLRGSLDVR